MSVHRASVCRCQEEADCLRCGWLLSCWKDYGGRIRVVRQPCGGLTWSQILCPGPAVVEQTLHSCQESVVAAHLWPHAEHSSSRSPTLILPLCTYCTCIYLFLHFTFSIGERTSLVFSIISTFIRLFTTIYNGPLKQVCSLSLLWLVCLCLGWHGEFCVTLSVVNAARHHAKSTLTLCIQQETDRLSLLL